MQLSVSICLAQNETDSRFRQYSIEDGLPSSTLFYVHQDRKGFMWFTSDAGVTKYDGYTFKNFTRSDGLPDNMILRTFEDSKGRLWLKAMKWEISYIQNDSVYLFNPENKLDGLILSNVTEDSNSVLWFCFRNGGIYKYFDNKLEKYTPHGLAEGGTNLKALPGGDFLFGSFKYWAEIKNDSARIHPLADSLVAASYVDFMVTSEGTKLITTKSHILVINESVPEVIFPDRSGPYINTVSEDKDGNLIVTTTQGVFVLSGSDSRLRVVDEMLMSKDINMVIEDREKNLWFTTRGNGILFLSRNARRMHNLMMGSPVQAVAKFPQSNTLCMGLQSGKLQFLNGHHEWSISTLLKGAPTNINDILIDNTNTLWCAVDGGLFILEEKETAGFKLKMCRHNMAAKIADREASYLLPAECNHIKWASPKSIVPGNNNDLWISSSSSLHNLTRDKNGNFITEVISWTRTSDACMGVDGRIWWGSPLGMNFFYRGSSMDSAPRFLVNANITDLEADLHGTIWVATNGSGIYAFRDSVLRNITVKDGISSDIINAILLDNGSIWAATTRGLDILEMSDETVPIKILHINKNDGLLSDEVNEVYIDGDTVYAATNRGLSVFNKSRIYPVEAPPPVYITKIEVEGKDTILLTNYSLEYSKNDFVIHFVSPTFKNTERTTYKYKLAGTDDNWKSTSSREINYAELKPGEYTFMVKAVNADGYESALSAELRLSIAPPYWQTTWFWLLIAISLLLIVAGIILAIIRYYRGRNELTNKIFEAEQKALRAQMNPHFVFNALYSIQNFITKNDQYSANVYLAKFSDLIRMTLDYSRNVSISVREEIKFLKTYLELESLRFENKFDYKIDIDPSVDIYKMKILSMLIQPFVENSIKHGLLPKKSKGELKVLLKRENGYLNCIIEDNGIGREKAMELKSRKSTGYKSQGIAITKERLELMRNGNMKGNISIIDLKDAEENVSGTRVILKIPYEVDSNEES